MFLSIKPGAFEIANDNHYSGYDKVTTSYGKEIYAKGVPRLFKAHGLTGSLSDRVIEEAGNNSLASIAEPLLRCEDINRWGDYLTGTFLLVIVDEKESICYIIVDLGNSFHLYESTSYQNAFLFSTDLDRLALETGNNDKLDYVSIVEYLTHQSVTYPHTFYNDIHEVPYASCIKIEYGGPDLRKQVHQYWLPTCQAGEVSCDVKGLGRELREGLLTEVEEMLSDKKKVGLLLSGGTDSRVLAGIMAHFGKKATAITVSDAYNQEVDIAGRVAKANGLKHEVLLRDQEYYPRLFKDSLRLEEPHYNFFWHMFLGLRDKIKGYGFDALFGAYMSDTLLKLHEANVVGRYFVGRHLGTLERFDKRDIRYLRGGKEFISQFAGIFREELLNEVNNRRARILKYWEDLRADGSAWEWSYLWPFTRNKHNSNLTTHIFHYPSYEIMTSRSVIEVARVASQKIKINGHLFNKAMFPLIRRSKGIPIANNMIRPTRFQIWDDIRIAVKHILPHRLFLRQQAKFVSDNPVATHRCTTNLRKVWETSTILERLRREYPTSDVTKGVLKKDMAVFDKQSYGALATNYAHHIMYTFLYLNAWRKLGKQHQYERTSET